MELIKALIDFILHIDKHLDQIINDYGTGTYLILFLIIFAETGLVVTPFLPGDSLLFAIGAISARGSLDLGTVIFLLFIAAVLGDTVNYHIGKFIGPKAFESNSRFLKKEHLMKTQKFYDKHGGKTIIFARFIPIIRTFAPFVAGIGTMNYSKFIAYNLIGGALWVAGFTLLGYYFGNMPIVKKNFTLVIFAIIILSVVPAVIEFIKQRKEAKAEA
jgi:membrane-associated protein